MFWKYVLIIFIILIIVSLSIAFFKVKKSTCDSHEFIIEDLLIFIFAIVAAVIIIISGHKMYQEHNMAITTTIVDALVVNKQYKSDYTTYVVSGKIIIPVSHSDQYLVKFKYNDIETSIDNKDLYNQVQNNEYIQMKLKTYIKSNNTIYKRELSLE